MAISHAKAHFQRLSAAQTGESKPADKGTANQYELMLLKLAEDKRRLKDVQSIERKIEVKRQLIPEYQPWIEGVLQSESGQQDDVLMSVFVWLIDIGDFAAALQIGGYAIEHDLVMPDQYKRDVATVLTEEIADQSLKAIAAEQPVDVQILSQVAELTDDKDMPDEVRAKLFKAMGYALRANAEKSPEDARLDLYQSARACLQRALDLFDKVGVKKDIERLDTLIKNSGSAQGGGA